MHLEGSNGTLINLLSFHFLLAEVLHKVLYNDIANVYIHI